MKRNRSIRHCCRAFLAFHNTPSRTTRRCGFTLIEMLVTVVVTLMVVAALVQAFSWIGDRVAVSRAVIEMSGTLRGVSSRLQQDLESVTVPLRPWPSPGSGLGYFEYVERPEKDYDPTMLQGATSDSTIGDRDDYLMMTVFSPREPFSGRYVNAAGTTTIQTSQYAEVVWWVRWEDLNGDGIQGPGEYLLHRRVLLIRPDLALNGAPFAGGYSFFQNNDISARVNNAGTGMVANSLADLTQRENRFGHDPRVVGMAAPAAPTVFEVNPIVLDQLDLKDDQQGEEVMLSHIRAFDVRAWDRDAILCVAANGELVAPGDAGWTQALAANSSNRRGTGAYVDLYYNPAVTAATTSQFSGRPRAPFLQRPAWAPWIYPLYDTWSLQYEMDGIDQDNAGGMNWYENNPDQATNGLDDDNANGVDDPGERETAPPYPVPLRGLQVRIRIFEPDTQQIRQVSVVTDFTPE